MGQGKGIGFWDIGDNRGGNYEDLVAMHKVFKMYTNVDFFFVFFCQPEEFNLRSF